MRQGNWLLRRLRFVEGMAELVDMFVDEGLDAENGARCQVRCESAAKEVILLVWPGLLNII